jgi:HSP20 family molecular chaperone IbpA
MNNRIQNNEAIQKHESQKPERVQENQTVTPRVDIYENDQEVLLIADLPGVSEKNLKINFDKDQLTIEGSREEEAVGQLLNSEYMTQNYYRAFLIPQGIDIDQISGDLKQGVLWLHLPKSEALKPRQISIKIG